MGSPALALPTLDALAREHELLAVFTQPDKKIGRRQEMKKSPVKELAEKNGIPVFNPESLKGGKAAEEIAKLRPDIIVVAAYGKILPKDILEIPKYGSINVHASLLPKFRGAAPVQGAILAGKKETGVTLMLMSEKLDAGEIITQNKVKISKDDSTRILTDKLAETGGKLLIETLPKWISGKIKAVPQDEKKASYCRSVKKEDGKIDWEESAEMIFRKWKAYLPWPGIFAFFCENGRRKQLKLVEIEEALEAGIGEKAGKVVEYKKQIAVQTGKGLIILKKIQLEGKRVIDTLSFLRGKKNFIGSYLK